VSTLSQDRDAIVTALAGVAGISATPTTPAPIVAGSAWPVWQDLSWVTVAQTLNLWHVFVALSNPNQLGTVEQGDQILYVVADALWGLGKVAIAEPYALPVEAGQQSVPVIRFSLEI